MAKRQLQEINAGSMADIAFLLLIFFLVTTTMDVDSGLVRRLPPPLPDDVEEPPPIRERNVFVVLINKDNFLAIKGEPLDLQYLTERTKEFIDNPMNKVNLSEGETLGEKFAQAMSQGNLEKAKDWDRLQKLFGPATRVSKGVVSLQNDHTTEYGMYIQVQNELVAAYNQLRDVLAMRTFGKKYDFCTDDQQNDMRIIYPLSISEAEPRKIGGGQ